MIYRNFFKLLFLLFFLEILLQSPATASETDNISLKKSNLSQKLGDYSKVVSMQTSVQKKETLTPNQKEKLAKIRVPFIENKGQVDKRVKFYAKTFGGTLFVTERGELVYSLPKLKKDKGKSKIEGGVVLKEILLNSKLKEIKGTKKSKTIVNYFIGNDKSQWKTNVSTYNTISLGEVYKGIELKLKAYGNNVEKLFYINPNSNVEQIKLSLKGAKNIKIDKKTGELVVETEIGNIKFTKPVAYQKDKGKKKYVKVSYIKLSENKYGFKIGNYDKSKTLIIDPLLASTFIGGSNGDGAHAIAIDSSGNVLIAGWTYSADYPATTGAYDDSFNGDLDVIVSKLDSNLTNLLASTFIGGSSGDEAHAIAIDSSGNVLIAGWTYSADYPATTGAYDDSFNGDLDVIVSKLDSNLTNLLASTFIGDSNGDGAHAIAIDSSGNVLIAGWTYSANYPTTIGAYDDSHNGYHDVIVSKLDSNLTNLLASTFIGGGSNDEANAIAIDSSDNVFITGWTYSANYPTTIGAYDDSHNGYQDVIVSKLDSNLTNLLASTFIGGGNNDKANAIAIDSSDNVFITGWTHSVDYPATTGAYDDSYNGYLDVIVSKLDSNLTNLLASTFIGGGSNDKADAIAIDSSGNVFIAGWAGSVDYPATTGAYDDSFNGYFDVIVSKLDSNLSVNHPPIINLFTASPNSGYAPLTVTFSWDVEDSDYDILTCYLDIDNNGISDYTINDCANNTFQIHTYVTSGIYTAKLTVDDGNGGTVNQTVDITVNAIVNYTLVVNKIGTGSGTVTSNPTGINCGSTCSADFIEGTSVILTATPDASSSFIGWSDDCSSCGTNTTCTITMDSNKTCTAEFDSTTGNGKMYGRYVLNGGVVSTKLPCIKNVHLSPRRWKFYLRWGNRNFVKAKSIEDVVCYDSPLFTPPGSLDFDTMDATLTGLLNGRIPVTIEVEMSDGGSSDEDYAHIIILDEDDNTIYEADGIIERGYIRALRYRNRR